MPDGLYLRLMFLLKQRRILRLKNPRTCSEKIQWMKLYGSLERYAPYVDKYEVRQYVADRIGPQYLIPLIGLWDEFDQIPLGDLPDRFVLKATHGCDYNFACRDRSSLDVASLRRAATRWLSTNFYFTDREPQYLRIRPRLIAEAYLEDDSGSLRDYKFTCFDGVPYVLAVMSDRAHGMTVNIYDKQWNLSPVLLRGYRNSGTPITRPALLDEMFEVAAKLSTGFAFVRVDLYYVGRKIYFGELTFTPASGYDRYEPNSFNLELGRMFDLSKFPWQSRSN